MQNSNGLHTLQVYAVGIIPYIGKILNFLLLSWMYAYYCYEYALISRLILEPMHQCLEMELVLELTK